MMVFGQSRQQQGRGRAIVWLFVLALALGWGVPSQAFLGGDDDDRPAKKCPSGKAWSDKARKCVALKSGSLSDEDLARAGRQLARDGHYTQAIAVLEAVTDKNDARVLTYLGYSHRKLGDVDLGISLYKKALAIDPDNVATREYLGEGYITKGELDLAYLELTEIAQRCGTACDEYRALEKAVLAARSQY